jgi:hypothetical protein
MCLGLVVRREVSEVFGKIGRRLSIQWVAEDKWSPHVIVKGVVMEKLSDQVRECQECLSLQALFNAEYQGASEGDQFARIVRQGLESELMHHIVADHLPTNPVRMAGRGV